MKRSWIIGTVSLLLISAASIGLLASADGAPRKVTIDDVTQGLRNHDVAITVLAEAVNRLIDERKGDKTP